MKLIYKLLDFFRGNKRKKPLVSWFKKHQPPPQKSLTIFSRDYKFNRAIRKEREIGVHPKYRNRQSQYSEASIS